VTETDLEILQVQNSEEDTVELSSPSNLEEARSKIKDLISTCKDGQSDLALGKKLTANEQLRLLELDLVDILKLLQPKEPKTKQLTFEESQL